jgi:hypothetical protein
MRGWSRVCDNLAVIQFQESAYSAGLIRSHRYESAAGNKGESEHNVSDYRVRSEIPSNRKHSECATSRRHVCRRPMPSFSTDCRVISSAGVWLVAATLGE